jgi:hypothetical protein
MSLSAEDVAASSSGRAPASEEGAAGAHASSSDGGGAPSTAEDGPGGTWRGPPVVQLGAGRYLVQSTLVPTGGHNLCC